MVHICQGAACNDKPRLTSPGLSEAFTDLGQKYIIRFDRLSVYWIDYPFTDYYKQVRGTKLAWSSSDSFIPKI